MENGNRRIIVRAAWDVEALVWVTLANSDIGLVTEAATLDALAQKLPYLASDLLECEPYMTPEIIIIKLPTIEALVG